MRLQYLETPALIVEQDSFEQNISKMQEIMKGSGAALRPHYKTHKCIAIAKCQVEAGAKGITCAKISEAEDLVNAGIKDVLIANQIVQKSKLFRLAFLAQRSKITVCVDHEQNIDDISAAAVAAGSTIHCYVEYDVGMNRCGVYSFEEVYVLARHILSKPGLTFDGIQAYAGQLAHSDRERREAEVANKEAMLTELVKYLKMRSIVPAEISGGSTGTVEFKARHGVYTEIQAGSYIFLDTSYSALETPFENSLYVASTVISKNRHAVIIDAGLKSFGSDQKPAKILAYPAYSINLHEEHGAILWENSPLQIGQTLLVVPGHCCTTVNLYDKIYVKKGEEIIDSLPITSRGKSV